MNNYSNTFHKIYFYKEYSVILLSKLQNCLDVVHCSDSDEKLLLHTYMSYGIDI